MTVLFLSCSVDTSLRLLEIAHAVVEGIKDHRACRRERDAQAGSRNLPHEHTASIVILETVDFIVAVLHAAANHGVADLFLFKKLLDKDNGLKVIGEVRAYEKGLTMDRPGWHNVLSLATREKADAILVMELGRVSRNPWMVMETLRELSEQGLMVFASDYSLSCNTILANKIKQASIAIHQI